MTRRANRGGTRERIAWLRGGAVALAVALLGACGDARPVGVARAEMTPAEQELMSTYREDNLLTARRLAEQVLEDDADSLVAHFVLGAVLRRAEGDLAGAMRSLDHARALYEATWPVAPAPPEAPWRLHREILLDIQELAQELEEHAYRLEVISYYDALYQPDLHSQRAWTLLQLGRWEEARASATAATESADPMEQTLGHNAACALSGRTLDREQRRIDCANAFEVASRRASLASTDPQAGTVNVAVHAYNAAQAALGAGDLDAAIRYLDAGAARFAFTPANPWRLRVQIELGRARGSTAADALVSMDEWRRRQPPWMRDQDRAETDAVFALAMAVFGHPAEGRVAIDRAAARPDRRGLVSTASSAQIGRILLIRRVLRRLAAIEARELAPWGGESRSFTASVRDAADQWRDDRRLLAVLAEDEMLRRTLMPWVEGGLAVPPWLAAEVLHVVGRGVGRAALDDAKTRDGHPAFAGHWAALEAEWALRAGRWRDALAQGETAWNTIPPDFAMVRARAAAVAHLAARELGDPAAAETWLNAALQADPSIVRRLDLEVPVIFVVSGPWGERVRLGLEASPRFRASNEGWTLRVESDTERVRACLDLPRAGSPPCVEVVQEDDEEPDAMLLRFARDFHREAFSLPVQGSTVNLRTLDGGTGFDASRARDQLRDSLDRVIDARAAGQRIPGYRKEER